MTLSLKHASEFTAVYGLNRLNLFFKSKQIPDLLIVEQMGERKADTEKLEALIKKNNLPLLYIAQSRALENRLKAVRTGAFSTLFKPFHPDMLIEKVNFYLSDTKQDQIQVLVVEDDASIASYYAQILTDAGMSVRVVTDPSTLFEALYEFIPNVILMDYYLPSCHGDELALILRQDDLYQMIPVVFISTETDKSRQFLAMNRSGADLFLTKPILPQHLVSAIQSAFKHTALATTYAVYDRLTGLLNHTYSLMHVEQYCFKGKRYKQPFAIAMIDIDNFKAVNDAHGHLAGDQALKAVSALLKDNLRESDDLGRYGGDEFILLLGQSDFDGALVICERIRGEIEAMNFVYENKKINLAVSIGIASFPQFQTPKILIAEADKALYEAKKKGRNQVCAQGTGHD